MHVTFRECSKFFEILRSGQRSFTVPLFSRPTSHRQTSLSALRLHIVFPVSALLSLLKLYSIVESHAEQRWEYKAARQLDPTLEPGVKLRTTPLCMGYALPLSSERTQPPPSQAYGYWPLCNGVFWHAMRIRPWNPAARFIPPNAARPRRKHTPGTAPPHQCLRDSMLRCSGVARSAIPQRRCPPLYRPPVSITAYIC